MTKREQASAYTDLGNAERLANAERWRTRYVPETKKIWHWDGKRFVPDLEEVITRTLMQKVVIGMYAEAGALDEAAERKAHVKHAQKSESLRAILAAVELLKSQSGIAIPQSDLNPVSDKLNFQNGTLDTRTLKLERHNPSDLITHLIPFSYNPSATAPRFQRFISEVMCDRVELIDFIQRAIGYSLTPYTTEQVLFLLLGSGANGKSLLMSVLNALFGVDLFVQIGLETLVEMAKSGSSPSPDIMALAGPHFGCVSETSSSRRLNEGLIKTLTGGDAISARGLYTGQARFRPRLKFWLLGNEKPAIRGTDDGIWRRILIIPFDAQFLGDRANRNLESELMQELPGIMNWALAGLAAWRRGGLSAPAAVVKATATYREEQDSLGSFLRECCEHWGGATESSKALLDAYNARVQKAEQLTPPRFAAELKKRGYAKHRTSDGYRWEGLRLLRDELFSAGM